MAGVIPPAERELLKANLIPFILQSGDGRVRLQLCVLLGFIFGQDYDGTDSSWPTLISQLQAPLLSQNPDVIHIILLAFRHISKSCEYKTAERREGLFRLVGEFFPVFSQLLRYLMTLTDFKSYDMQRLICKIFYSCSTMVLPPYLHNPPVLLEWMSLFMDILKRDLEKSRVSEVSDPFSHPLCKTLKWVTYITVRFFQRYGNPDVQVEDSQRKLATYFLETFACPLLEAHIWVALKPRRKPEVFISEVIMVQCLNFMQTAVGLAVTSSMLKNYLQPLLSEIIFPELCIKDDDVELWTEDPHEYSRKQYDIFETAGSSRAAAIQLVDQLINRRTSAWMDPTLSLVSSVFTSSAGVAMEEDSHLARQLDGALSIIGCISRKFMSKEPYASQVPNVVEQFVLPYLHSPIGYLRARGCWTLARFTSVMLRTTEVFQSAILTVLSLLQDNDLPVRIEALLCIRNYLREEKGVLVLRPYVGQVLQAFFALIKEIENDELVSSLETVIEVYPDEVTAQGSLICRQLVEAFTAMAVVSDREDYDSSFAAGATLSVIVALLRSSSKYPDILAQMEPPLCLLLDQILGNEEMLDYVEEALDILAHLAYSLPTITPGLWHNLETLFKMFSDCGIEFMAEIYPVMVYFTLRCNGQLSSAAGPSHLALMHQFVNHVTQTIVDPSDSDLMYVFRIMHMIFMVHRGQVDSYLSVMLQTMLARLQVEKVSQSMRIIALQSLAVAFYYNAAATLSWMESTGSTPFLMQEWFAIIQKQERLIDLQVTSLGLSSLLRVAPSQLPPSVTTGLALVVRTALKVARQYVEEKEKEEGYENEEGDEDEVNPELQFAELLGGGSLENLELGDSQNQGNLIDMEKLRELAKKTAQYWLSAEGGDDHLIDDDSNLFYNPIWDVDSANYLVREVVPRWSTPEFETIRVHVSAELNADFCVVQEHVEKEASNLLTQP